MWRSDQEWFGHQHQHPSSGAKSWGKNETQNKLDGLFPSRWTGGVSQKNKYITESLIIYLLKICNFKKKFKLQKIQEILAGIYCQRSGSRSKTIDSGRCQMSHNTLNRQEKASVFGQLLHFRDTMMLVFCLALSFKDLFWDDLSGGGGKYLRWFLEGYCINPIQLQEYAILSVSLSTVCDQKSGPPPSLLHRPWTPPDEFPPQFSDTKGSSKSSLCYPLTTMGGAAKFASLLNPPHHIAGQGHLHFLMPR